MKLETVKSFILVVLIGISLFLSFTLWSYQPNSERTLRGEIVTDEMEIGGSTEESKRSIVKPSDIIFHTAEEYYGYIHASDRDALYEDMQDWVISNFESNDGGSGFDFSGSGVEIIFPDEIPMGIMNSLFTFQMDEIELPSWSMDRMFIRFVPDSKSLHLEFVSSANNRVATAVINETTSFDKLWSKIVDFDNNKLRRYIAINEDTSPIYIPAGPVTLPTYTITPTEINPNSMVNILFSNPAVVRETSSQSIGETYFTDSRQLSIYQDRMRMEFVNHATPSTEEEMMITEIDLLDRSINNINSHGGWTENIRSEDYRLEEIGLAQHRIKYQLHYEGYPVFNNSKLSTIQQAWSIYQNSYQLIEYHRPLFLFESEFSLNELVEQDDLTAGEDVVAYLKNDPDIILENIQDIKVSYELKYQLTEEFFVLDPSWYKKENNAWQKIIFDEDLSPKGVD